MNRKRWRRILIGEWSWVRLVRSLVLIYAIVALYVFFRADAMIFVPGPASYQDDAHSLKLPVSPQETISAVFYPNPNATYTLLYSHGNAEDLGDIDPILQELVAAGFNVLAYDYRGYGTSDGTPSEAHTYVDITAAYDYLTQKRGIEGDRILLLGRSVGGGPAADLATRVPVAGLILESTFTTAFRTVIPIPIFPFEKFNTIAKLAAVNCPVLVIHGTADQTIPLDHGQQLWAAAPDPKQFFWVQGAGHNDLIWVAGSAYRKTLQDFTEELEERSLK
ncbi:alpha/beta hydrolase [Spirulina major CS-329]|uniref:alpha/beta hydrolase n=1 Tax=Spirulina TaxID=1154 RepID=UPI002330F7C1|nr:MULTISPECIES: alpha/beta hydrolase [Spirulina]MDB9496068.1 alpha/beta hydrolase [Spirulina subsalsa CS-330]MDB9503749.1 alpha/beta hydrolase [Spirulina major CS-329]